MTLQTQQRLEKTRVPEAVAADKIVGAPTSLIARAHVLSCSAAVRNPAIWNRRISGPVRLESLQNLRTADRRRLLSRQRRDDVQRLHGTDFGPDADRYQERVRSGRCVRLLRCDSRTDPVLGRGYRDRSRD